MELVPGKYKEHTNISKSGLNQSSADVAIEVNHL